MKLDAACEKYGYEIPTRSLVVTIIIWYRIWGADSDEYS